MPAGVPEGVVRIRHRAGLEGDVNSVWESPAAVLVADSEGAKAIVSSSLASVASTLSSSCS